MPSFCNPASFLFFSFFFSFFYFTPLIHNSSTIILIIRVRELYVATLNSFICLIRAAKAAGYSPRHVHRVLTLSPYNKKPQLDKAKPIKMYH